MSLPTMQSLLLCRVLNSGISATSISQRSIGFFKSRMTATGSSGEKKKAKTPMGKLDQSSPESQSKKGPDPFAPFPQGLNPSTGEIGGPTGPEPTRYGDWERKGRVTDF